MNLQTPKTQSFVEIDLECVSQHSDSVRDQSKRFSHFLSKKTELYRLHHDPSSPGTTESPSEQKYYAGEKDSSGLRYWIHELKLANVHGGDYTGRSRNALRTALGSLLTFSILVFPHQQILGAVWIGNIFMHANIKDSFGSSLTSVKGYAQSIVLTTACSWPFAFSLSQLSTGHACIVLPVFVFLLSFVIMSCPRMIGRNVMILVMYIILAAPVRDTMIWWNPFGYAGTFYIGLSVALLMNIFNFSLTSTHRHLLRLEKDLIMLLLQCKAYSETTGTASSPIPAMANIEMLQTRIVGTVKKLKCELPASKVELSFLCKSRESKDLSGWITQTGKMLGPLESLRTSLVQRVIGEEYTMYSPHLRDAKVTINEEIGPARDRMVDSMIAAIAVCHAWADPSSHRTVLPNVHGELKEAIRECFQDLHQAFIKAAKKLEANPQDNIPIFAHLSRRMTSFNALFELGDSLQAYLQKHSWESEEVREKKRETFLARLFDRISSMMSFVDLRWLLRNPDSLRLALKTSVGMFLASMFVSVPYLWNISKPFGVWPGLTIASINLGTTGSSFHKASDRLSGTMIAAAYALIVTDLFPGNADYVKIPAITFFTFTVIYLRSDEHAYRYTYAATSIGSMLYGSIKNDFDIMTYIPKRIELIFVGVVLFGIVELLLFPRSSRRIVESSAFELFLSFRDFLGQAARTTRRMEEYVVHSSEITEYGETLFDEIEDVFQLEDLVKFYEKTKRENTRLSKELESGLNEPNLGLSMPLHPEVFRGLAKHFSNCEVQAMVLLKELKNLGIYYKEEGHPIRKMNWSCVHARFLQDAFITLDHACKLLEDIYPDGRLRAQHADSVKSVTAAASFRAMEDVRLRTISEWSHHYLDFTQKKEFQGSDPSSVMTIGNATMCILELCHLLQKAGKHVEEIAHHFPTR